MTIQTIGFIGLGVMGQAMARTLSARGFRVVGFDISVAARERAGAIIEISADLPQLLGRTSTVVLSLPTSQHVEAVIEGADGVLAASIRPGLVIDTSTSHPASTRRLARLLGDKGIDLVDAPVSGGRAGAETGGLAMAVGGLPEAIERARPVLAALARKIVVVGGPGSGHVTKLVNNLLCASHLLIAGEAMRLARHADVDLETVLEAVNGGSGRSGVTETNFPRWVLPRGFDSGFTMALMRKDVRLALDLSRSLGIDLPCAETIAGRWHELTEVLGPNDDFNKVADPFL